MTGLLKAIQEDRGQPATVRMGTVTSTSPLIVAVQGTNFDPDSIGLADMYVPTIGDNVALLGQSAVSSDGSSWLAVGGARAGVAGRTGVLIKYGRRETSSGTTTTTALGVLRVDNIQLCTGNQYLIKLNTTLFTTVANDSATMRAHLNLAGAATTASTLITLFNSGAVPNVANGISATASVVFTATSNTTTASVLMAVFRLTGTGNISAFGDPVVPSEIAVYEVGRNISNDGVSL